eukprot:3880754-Rhodomonas_salina.2
MQCPVPSYAYCATGADVGRGGGRRGEEAEREEREAREALKAAVAAQRGPTQVPVWCYQSGEEVGGGVRLNIE